MNSRPGICYSFPTAVSVSTVILVNPFRALSLFTVVTCRQESTFEMMQLESTVFPPHKKMPSLNLGYITQKLGAQTLNEVQPYVPLVPFGDYYGSDSEEENHEVELYLKEKRMCNSLVTSALQNNNNTIPLFHSVSKPLRPLEDSSNSTENIQNQTQMDRHSSEGEPTYDRPPPEKRKYSQVCSWGMMTSDLSSSSSDDEVRELCFATKNSPIQFGSSPPKHVPRFLRRFADSNNLTLANCAPTSQLPVCESSSAQPRKRHRHSYTIERHYLQNGRCVDFEKMQQKQTTKKFTNQGITSSRGARVVRIKSITHNISRVPPRLLCDPAVYSFKSLSTINPLTPVEEPAVAAF